jgi:5-methylcytosine-specific restriction endonuclease McrA
LPLDVGETSHIPAHIRRAVTVRDRGTCAFPGGCGKPAMHCEHHHTVHRAHGGRTAVRLIALFCTWHHNHLIHNLGWSVTIEPDGTMTARKPDGSIYKRSHPPPPRPG